MMTKMEKTKIKSIVSKECNKERSDFFVIEISDELHKNLISLLIKLGFKYDEIEDFDSLYKGEDLFIFVCKNNLRVYLTNGSTKDEILLIIDSTLKKEDLINKIEEYFQIF